MSQDPNNIGLLPPPPLLPTQPLPMPSVSQYSTQTHYPPPLPPPPLQPMYGVQYQAANMQAGITVVRCNFNNPGGIPTQPHYNPTPAAAALNPVNQAQAIYAAASQMMIGNMMMDHMSTNKRDRRKRRSGSPKRRMRSRSESPQRSKKARDNKRRRNRSPYHKRSYNKTSPQKRVEKKIEDKKEEKIENKEKEEENLYQPPTPEENVVAADTEPENDMPDGSKTPDYKAEEDGTPKTPEYDARTGSAVTPPSSTSDKMALTSSRDVTSSTNVTYNSLTSSSTTKTVDTVKPTPALPKMISLKKIRDTADLSSPVPDVGVKSLADILREQALKSMKRKPTPERESDGGRKSRDVTPEPDNIRTRAESPTLDRSTTETAKLSRPFDNIDSNMFKPETGFESEEDFYSDDEFDPKKYDRNSEDDLLASPDHKNDLTGITMNFTVTPKMTKEEKRQAKLEKKKAKELKKLKRKQKQLKKLAKKQNQAAENSTKEVAANSSDKAAPTWQKRLISSHLGGEKTPNTTSPTSTPPTTPDHEEAEFLKTPEKCDQIFFESEQTQATEEPKPKKKSKRKVVVINKDPASSFSQIEIPESKPEVDLSSISTSKPLGHVFGATIRSLLPPKAEQINTVSTTASRQQTKGFNPFAPAPSQPSKLTSAPAKITPPVTVSAPTNLAAPASSTTSLAAAVPTLSNTSSIRPLNNPFAKPDTSRRNHAEPKPVRRLGGVKTIRIKKSAPTTTATVPEQKVCPVKTAGKPPPKRPVSPIDEDLDDIDKELDLLNAALDVAPTSIKSATKPKSQNLEDDDDLFADIEEFLNEERRNL